MVECRFPSDKAYPSELDNELPLKVNTDPTTTSSRFEDELGRLKKHKTGIFITKSSSNSPEERAADHETPYTKA